MSVSARRPGHRTAAEKMKVQVLYSLAAVLTAVVDDAVAVREPFLRGELLGNEENVRDDRRVFLCQRIGRSDVHSESAGCAQAPAGRDPGKPGRYRPHTPWCSEFHRLQSCKKHSPYFSPFCADGALEAAVCAEPPPFRKSLFSCIKSVRRECLQRLPALRRSCSGP